MQSFWRWAVIFLVAGVGLGAAAAVIKRAASGPRQPAAVGVMPPEPDRVHESPQPAQPELTPAKADAISAPAKADAIGASAPLEPSKLTPESLESQARSLVEDKSAQAAELLESALALDPANRERRIRAFAVHRLIATTPHRVAAPERLSRDDPASAEISRRVSVSYCAALGHLESLIRNRQVEAELALYMLATITPQKCHAAYPRGFDIPKQHVFHPGAEHVAAAEAVKDRFAVEVMPLILSLTQEKADSLHDMRVKTQWQHLATSMATARLSLDRSKQHIALLKQVVSGFPQGIATDATMTYFLGRHGGLGIVPNQYEGDRCTPQEWSAFLTELAQHKSRHVAAYGRWGLISQKMEAIGTTRNIVLLKEVVAEADALLDDFQALPFNVKVNGMGRTHEALFQETLKVRNRAATQAAISVRVEPPRAANVISLGPPPYQPTGATLEALNFVPPR